MVLKKEPSIICKPMKMEDPNAPKDPFAALRAYRERGDHLHRLEQFHKAKSAYDEAYKYEPENVPLLVKRSAACVDGFLQKQALQDAEEALKLEPGNVQALYCKARALDNLREFERSVVVNYLGYQRYKKPNYFTMGINTGLTSIDKAIGKATGQVLLRNYRIIKDNLKHAVDEHAPDQIKHQSRIPYTKVKAKLTQTEAHKRGLQSRVLAYKYLGVLAYDKFFLESLLTDNRVISANAKGSQEVRSLAKKALAELSMRQNVLREQEPYYTMKTPPVSHHQILYKKKLLEKERAGNIHNAEKWMKQVDQCQRQLHIGEMMKKAERMQTFLNSKTKHTLPSKNNYTDRLYATVGRGYLSQYRLSTSSNERAQRRRIAFLMRLPIARPTSYDSVIAHYAYRFIDPKHAIQKTLATLELCENNTMMCWLLYELSKLMLTVKNYTMSSFYAKRCQYQAEKMDDAVWWLNGCFALMSGDMIQGNVNEVRIATQEAYEWTKNTSEAEQIQAFLSKCSEIVAELQDTDDSKELVKRERNILKNLDMDTRQEAKRLFKRISMVPCGRRFSVLPRKGEGKKTSERHRRHQRHLSIIPGPDRGTNLTSHTPIPGFQIFEA